MTGSIMFFIIELRSDIIFTIFVVSRLAKNVRYSNNKVVKTIVQYIKVTGEVWIICGKE